MKRLPALTLAFALAALSAAFPPDRAPRGVPPAQAQEDSLERTQRARMEEIQRQAREKREAATKLKTKERQALGQLRRTERELSLTRRRLRDLSRKRQNLDIQLQVTHSNLSRNLAQLSDQKARLRRRLRVMYEFGPAREIEFLLSSQSFAQILTRWDYLMMVAEHDRQLLEDVERRKEVVETLEQRLEGHRQQVERTAHQTTAENTRLARQRSQRESAVHDIQTQRQAYEAAAAELERTARSIQRLLAQLEARRRAEQQRARAEGRPITPYTGDFSRARGALDWPVRGDVVGRFGIETNPRFPDVKVPNNGIDIATPIGTAVHAVAKGKVDYVNDDFASYGQVVIVNHGDGYYTLYAHLSDIGVSVGQEVTPGQLIGRSGDTGSLKGPVLHFEVRRGGSALNPEDWLR